MDRELLHEKVGLPAEPGFGIQELMTYLADRIPGLAFSSHTPYVGRAHAYVS